MNVRIDTTSDRMRMHRNIIRGRVRFGFYLVASLFILLAGRLSFIQLFKHNYWVAEAKSARQHKEIVLSQRGMILDRNGIPLAINVSVGDFVADPFVINDPATFAYAVAPFVPGTPAATIQAQIASAKLTKTPTGKFKRYVLIAKGVAYEHVEAFQAEFAAEKKAHVENPKQDVELTGASVTTRWVRSYPKGTLACHVVGFLSKDKLGNLVGNYGVEKSLNAQLTGTDGYVVHETDAQGREIPGTETDSAKAQDGRSVELTIDANIQRFAEAALAKTVADHHAESGTCVVMDPKTGEILALANAPTFNPNNLAGTTYKQWDDRAVSDLYEPGSTLKSITMAAVLDSEGMAMQYKHVFCNGSIQIGNHTVHCAKDPPLYGVHGDETMRDVLKNSCNIGAAQFAMGLGSDKLFQYERAFGFLDRPDVGLPGVQHSRLIPPDVKPWSEIELANIGFGQGVSVTPIQLTTAYCILANGGHKVYPHILKDAPVGPSVQVVKPEVASTLLSMLQTVVEEGTGKPAQIDGYNIGGKTGSAQVADHGHYGDEYIGSFCGVVPLTDPKLVILCAVNKPVGVHWGAVVAAPVVHDVAEQSLWYMGVPRDAPDLVDYADEKKNATPVKVVKVARVGYAKARG